MELTHNLLEPPLALLPKLDTTLTTRARAQRQLVMLTTIVRLVLSHQFSVHLVLNTLVVLPNKVIVPTSPLVHTELVHQSLALSQMVTTLRPLVSITQFQPVVVLSAQLVLTALVVLRLPAPQEPVARTRRLTKMFKLVLTSAMLVTTVSVELIVDIQLT